MLSGFRVSVARSSSLVRRSTPIFKPHIHKVKFSTNTESRLPFGTFTSLIKPALFTGIFVGTTIVVGEYATRQSRTGLWKDIKDKIRELTRTFIPQGRGLTYSMIAINAGVLLFMYNPAAKQFLARYFTHSIFNSEVPNFQQTTFAYASFVLWTCWIYALRSEYNVQAALGPERTLAMYLSAGVFSNFASHISPAAGLGASGAICGLFSAFCMLYPNVQMQFLILPGVTLSAKEIIMVPIVVETLLLIFMRNRIAIDFAAHLGGFAFGAAYVYLLRQYVEMKRRHWK